MTGYLSPPGFTAGGTIVCSRFVKQDPSNDRQVLQAVLGDYVLGVAQMGTDNAPIPSNTQNAAVSGEDLQVYTATYFAWLEAGAGGWTRGLLMSDANAAGVPWTPGNAVAAVAFENAAVGEVRQVLVLPAPAFGVAGVKSLAATATLLATDSGKDIFVTATGQTFTLPAPAVGLRFNVINAVAASGTIVATPSGKLYQGGVAGTSNTQATNTSGTAHFGDRLSLVCDGTNYYAFASGTWAQN